MPSSELIKAPRAQICGHRDTLVAHFTYRPFFNIQKYTLLEKVQPCYPQLSYNMLPEELILKYWFGGNHTLENLFTISENCLDQTLVTISSSGMENRKISISLNLSRLW